MTQQEKLNLIVELSIPSILAQLSSIIMFFIDMAMVGHLRCAAGCLYRTGGILHLGILWIDRCLFNGIFRTGSPCYWCQRL